MLLGANLVDLVVHKLTHMYLTRGNVGAYALVSPIRRRIKKTNK